VLLAGERGILTGLTSISESRGTVTFVALVTLLLFLAGITANEGKYIEALVYLSASFLVWAVSRQRMGSLQTSWMHLRQDLRDATKLTVALLIIATSQLLLFFSPVLLFRATGDWTNFLIIRSNEISLGIAFLGIGAIFGSTILRHWHEPIELLRRMSGEATEVGIVFVFLPVLLVSIPSSMLHVVGIILFLLVIVVHWILNRPKPLKRIAVLAVTSLLISQVIVYSAGFTQPQDQELFETMYSESATGMRTLGASWRDLSNKLHGEMRIGEVPILTDSSGRRVAIDYHAFELAQSRLSELHEAMHSEAHDATLHLNLSAQAAQSLANRSQRFVRALAASYYPTTRGLSNLAIATDSVLELVLLIHRSILDEQASRTSLASAERLLDLVDETEEVARSAGMATDTIQGLRELAELLYSAALFRNGTEVRATLTRGEENYELNVSLTCRSHLKAVEASVLLLPETKWVIEEGSVHTAETGAGLTTLATITENNGQVGESYPTVLVISVVFELHDEEIEIPFVQPINASSQETPQDIGQIGPYRNVFMSSARAAIDSLNRTILDSPVALRIRLLLRSTFQT